MKRKPRKPKPAAPTLTPVSTAEMLADAHAEYRRAKEAKDREASKTNVEAFHRARTAINQLSKIVGEQAATKPAGVMTRKR